MGMRARSFNRKRDQKFTAIAYEYYLGARSPIIIVPSKDENVSGNGNGSGTFIRYKDRVFMATAKHVADALSKKDGFVTMRAPLSKRDTPPQRCKFTKIYHRGSRDVALIEVNPKLVEELDYSTLSTDEIVPDYREASNHRVAWAGWPYSIRGKESADAVSLTFHPSFTTPVVSVSKWEKMLRARYMWDTPLDLKYDFFAIRKGKGQEVESGNLVETKFPLQGISGGGLWLVPRIPPRKQLVDPSRSQFLGIVISAISAPRKSDYQWVRVVRGKVVLSILQTV